MNKKNLKRHLKKLDEHPNQVSLDHVKVDSRTQRRIWYSLNICSELFTSQELNIERVFISSGVNRAVSIRLEKLKVEEVLGAMQIEFGNKENSSDFINAQLNIIYNELKHYESHYADKVLPELENYHFKVFYGNVFYTKEAKEGFEHLLEAYSSPELNTKHFKVLWFNYSTNSNKLIIKCKAEDFRAYVYGVYLKGAKRTDFTNNSPTGAYAERMKVLFERQEKTFKNSELFKKII